MKAVSVLRAMRKKIAKPEQWCKRAFALNDCGQSVYPRSPRAVKWCAIGALMADGNDRVEGVVTELSAALPGRHRSLLAYNDSTTHANVLALIDRAIAAAKKKLVSK